MDGVYGDVCLFLCHDGGVFGAVYGFGVGESREEDGGVCCEVGGYECGGAGGWVACGYGCYGDGGGVCVECVVVADCDALFVFW